MVHISWESERVHGPMHVTPENGRNCRSSNGWTAVLAVELASFFCVTRHRHRRHRCGGLCSLAIVTKLPFSTPLTNAQLLSAACTAELLFNLLLQRDLNNNCIYLHRWRSSNVQRLFLVHRFFFFFRVGIVGAVWRARAIYPGLNGYVWKTELRGPRKMAARVPSFCSRRSCVTSRCNVDVARGHCSR